MEFKNELIKNINTLSSKINENMPRVLEGAGIIFFALTIAETVKATKRMPDAMAKAEKDKGSELTTREKIFTVAKNYAKVGIYGIESLGCFNAATNEALRRYAAAMVIAEARKSELDSYILAAREVVGAGKESKIKQTAMEERVKEMVGNGMVFRACGDGCSEKNVFPEINLNIFGNPDSIRKAFYACDDTLRRGCDVTLRDLLDEISSRVALPPGTKYGFEERLGFKYDDIIAHHNYKDNEMLFPFEEDAVLIDGEVYHVWSFTLVPLEERKNWDFYENQFMY